MGYDMQLITAFLTKISFGCYHGYSYYQKIDLPLLFLYVISHFVCFDPVAIGLFSSNPVTA